MGDVLQPVGPEPRVVYLRRRAVAVGVAVVSLVAVVWLGSSVAGGAPDPAPGQAAVAAAITASAPSPSAAASLAPRSAPPSASSAAASSGAPPSAAAPSAAPVEGGPPAACSDTAINVVAQVAAPAYPAGTQPVFRLLVSNAGKVACTADLNASLQQVIVYSADGSKRVWSSNDCFPGTTPDVRTLAPGAQAVYSIQWSGTTSTAGCKTARVAAGPGPYIVVAVLGTHQSPPAPFTIT